MKITSINSHRNPYQRPDAWLKGVKGQRPLIESFSDKVALGKKISPRQRVLKMLEKFDGQWAKTSEEYKALNGL